MSTTGSILINCLSALQGGGQTYLLQLFSHIPQHLKKNVVILSHIKNQHLWEALGIEVIAARWASTSIVHRIVFETALLPRLMDMRRIHVYVAPAGLLPFGTLSGVKTVTIFQNLLPFAPIERRRYPIGYMRLRLWLLRFGMNYAFQRANLVICLSRHSQTILTQKLPRLNGHTVVVPHGLDPDFLYTPERPLPPNIQGEYVLYVSILDVYKAQIEVIQAWHLLQQQRNTRERLLLIGPAYPPYARKVKRLIQTLHLEDCVEILGKIPYKQLPMYYQHAKINLFASSCETFGIILLEKLAAGKPVFCSCYHPFQEIAGDAAIYFDPYAPEQLTRLLLKYLDDEHGRAELGRRALQQSLQFDWKTTAEKTWNLLAELLETS